VQNLKLRSFKLKMVTATHFRYSLDGKKAEMGVRVGRRPKGKTQVGLVTTNEIGEAAVNVLAFDDRRNTKGHRGGEAVEGGMQVPRRGLRVGRGDWGKESNNVLDTVEVRGKMVADESCRLWVLVFSSENRRQRRRTTVEE
jgi:hypothetical protein